MWHRFDPGRLPPEPFDVVKGDARSAPLSALRADPLTTLRLGGRHLPESDATPVAPERGEQP